jgi:hypothetical protein
VNQSCRPSCPSPHQILTLDLLLAYGAKIKRAQAERAALAIAKLLGSDEPDPAKRPP